MLDLPQNKKIVLFDGVCNLCESSVQYIIKHNKNDVFRFVSLQSDLGKQVVNHIKIDTNKTDSIILYIPGKAYYYKSQAALEIANDLSGFNFLFGLFKIVPTKIGDHIYDYIAKNRYNWYGKKESCMIPSEEIKSKFLE